MVITAAARRAAVAAAVVLVAVLVTVGIVQAGRAGPSDPGGRTDADSLGTAETPQEAVQESAAGTAKAIGDTPAHEEAGRLIAYATGAAPDLSWSADGVDYLIAGERVRRLSPHRADRPASWRACPPGQRDYDGIECPVSPLATIAGAQADGLGPTIVDDPPVVVGCTKPRRPEARPGSISVTIVPDPDRADCFSAYSVTLYLDPSGDVAAVDLVRSSP